MSTISFAVTAHDEHVELERLLKQLCNYIRPGDEIVLQLDTTATPEVRKVTEDYNCVVEIIEFPLNKDFATFKNNLKEHCSKEWIFFLDADEYLANDLAENIHEILDLNPNIDLFLIPRANYVEGITEEHFKQWGWNKDQLGRINYPDNQSRIVKNVDYISWKGKVHERLVGNIGLLTSVLPDDYNLIHPKTIQKQEFQNKLYSEI